MNRSQLSTTFQRVVNMVDHVRENLDDDEYDLFLDMVAPLPEVEEVKKATKRGAKKKARQQSIPLCVACGYAEASIVHKDDSLKDFHQFQSSKSATRSSRASGMAAAISKSLDAQRRVTKTVNLCVAEVDDNGGLMTCGLPADDNIHHMSSVDGYYEFQPGKSAAPPVAEKSSTNGRSGLTGFTRKSDSI